MILRKPTAHRAAENPRFLLLCQQHSPGSRARRALPPLWAAKPEKSDDFGSFRASGLWKNLWIVCKTQSRWQAMPISSVNRSEQKTEKRRCKSAPDWVLRVCIGVLFDEVFAAGACGHAPLRDADMGSAAAEEAAEAGGEFFEVVADLFQGGHGFVEGVHIQALEGIGCLSQGGDGLVETLHIQV